MSADWAGTTVDRYDLHRFTTDKQALCDRAIRTYSVAPDDCARRPWAILRTRDEILAEEFAHLYRFCVDCSAADAIRNES